MGTTLCSNSETSFACESQGCWVLQGFIFLHFPPNIQLNPFPPLTPYNHPSSLTLLLFLLMPRRKKKKTSTIPCFEKLIYSKQQSGVHIPIPLWDRKRESRNWDANKVNCINQSYIAAFWTRESSSWVSNLGTSVPRPKSKCTVANRRQRNMVACRLAEVTGVM